MPPTKLHVVAAVAATLLFSSFSPVEATTLVADGISYSLTGVVVNSTTDQFTLTIAGINGFADTEKGRSGINAISFGKPAYFFNAVMITPAVGFSEQNGGLNSNGCDGKGNFFCFKATSKPAKSPALAANSSLSFVFDVSVLSGSLANWLPDFKIDWVGSKNNYDLVSEILAPTFAIIGGQGGEAPLPTTLPLFASGLGALALLRWLRKRKVAASAVA